MTTYDDDDIIDAEDEKDSDNANSAYETTGTGRGKAGETACNTITPTTSSSSNSSNSASSGVTSNMRTTTTTTTTTTTDGDVNKRGITSRLARDSLSAAPTTRPHHQSTTTTASTTTTTTTTNVVGRDKAIHNPLLNVEDSSMHSSLGSSLHIELEERYFCSELVANALQCIGALPSHLQPSSVWPGGFASGQMVDEWMEPGASFGNIVHHDISAHICMY
jgi:hypothetical protein